GREQIGAFRAQQAPALLRAERQATRAQKQGRIAVLKELEQMLRRDVERSAEEVRVLSTAALKVASLREKMTDTKSRADKAAAEAEALRVEIQAPPRVTLHED